MYSRTIFFLLSFFCFCSYSLLGQGEGPWSLQQCLNYALENNLRLQQTELSVQSSELRLQQARNNRYPNLNASASANNNFGFNINPLTNSFSTDGTQALSFGLGGGMTIYNGLRLSNLIKQSEIDLRASQSELDDSRNMLMLNIATAYLQILSDMETLEAAKVQLESTVQQRDRTAKLVRAGTLPQADLLQLESQIATDERALINTENTLEISYLNLARTLNLSAGEAQDFEIQKPEIPAPSELNMPSMQEIINTAFQTQPSVEAADLRVKSAQIDRAVSAAGKLPSVNLNGNLGTGYTTFFKVPDPANPSEQIIVPFSDQVINAFGGGVGVSLGIPIYNRGQVSNNIQQAIIGLENANLNADIVRQNLEQNIQQAYVDVENAYSNYQAIVRQIEALQLTFENTEKQFNLGLVNSVDYMLAKNNLNRAQFDMVRNKYIFFFRQKVLDFYMGKPFTF
jgi:outer membrane protein